MKTVTIDGQDYELIGTSDAGEEGYLAGIFKAIDKPEAPKLDWVVDVFEDQLEIVLKESTPQQLKAIREAVETLMQCLIGDDPPILLLDQMDKTKELLGGNK